MKKTTVSAASPSYDPRYDVPSFVLHIPCTEENKQRLENCITSTGDENIGEFFRAALISTLVNKHPKLINIFSHCEVENDALVQDILAKGRKKIVPGVKLKFYGASGEVVRHLSDEPGLLKEATIACIETLTLVDDLKKNRQVIAPTPRVSFDGPPILH